MGADHAGLDEAEREVPHQNQGRPGGGVGLPQVIAAALSRGPREARDAARHPLTMYIGQQPHIALAIGVDPVIFDPEKKHRISHKTTHMNVDYSPYEGREVTGAVESVLLRGRVMLEKGNFAGRAGDGRFIKRSPSEPSSLL